MEIIVNKEDVRIDKYLKDNTSYSREFLTKMLKDGFILVNEKNID